MRARTTVLGALVIAAIAVAIWWLCQPRLSHRKQIEELVVQIERGIETKNLRQVMAGISEDYNDPLNQTKRDVYRVGAGAFRNQGDFEVTINRFFLDVDGKQAHADIDADVRVITSQGTATSIFSGTVAVDFRRERKGWKVISAQGWQEADLGGL